MSLEKIFVILSALMVATLPLAAAQSQSEVGPGMIGADSPIYGLETAFDNAAVTVGLKRAGQVAQERAAEAEKAADAGKPEAAERAARNMQKIAGKAKNEEDEEGVQKAMSSLQGSMDRLEQQMQNATNEQARQGMQTALDNMQGALDNMGEAQLKREQARERANRTGENGQQPDSDDREDSIPEIPTENTSPVPE